MTRNAILPAWMARPRREDEPIEVPIADAPAATLFFALDTQWRRHAMSGQRIGIDYAAIAPTAALYEIAMSADLMADLRMMEATALAELARQETRRARR